MSLKINLVVVNLCLNYPAVATVLRQFLLLLRQLQHTISNCILCLFYFNDRHLKCSAPAKDAERDHQKAFYDCCLHLLLKFQISPPPPTFFSLSHARANTYSSDFLKSENPSRACRLILTASYSYYSFYAGGASHHRCLHCFPLSQEFSCSLVLRLCPAMPPLSALLQDLPQPR